MKAIKICLFYSLAATLFSCSSTKENFEFVSAEVVMLSGQGYETITLRSHGYGNNKEEAFDNAEKLVFENIFFRGIPNSNYSEPLIGINETAEKAKHVQYLNAFFNQRMRTFILNSFTSTPFQKKKGIHYGTIDLKINMKSLKKDLQEHGVIRKFGF